MKSVKKGSFCLKAKVRKMKKIRIGVFGADRGRTMIDVLFAHPEATLVAVCDGYKPLLDSVERAAREKGIEVALFENFEDFFKFDMDAVILANYADEHAPFAIRLLRSGRHVLSECLPCASMAQAVELIEAVEETGLVYALAENYSYSNKTFEMWRRYENGDIGEVMYAEGEYVHDCTPNWIDLTRGDRNHWRSRGYSTFYCTHSIAPIITTTGRRPVQVVGFESQVPDYFLEAGIPVGAVGVEMITLDNGAILRSQHGGQRREPMSANYIINGTKGTIETSRLNADNIAVYVHGKDSAITEYTPEKHIEAALAAKFPTHGGADFYPTHLFIERILGHEDGLKYSINVYQAVDMCICGILAYRSIVNGSIPIKVPNLRNKEERDAYRNDHACANPEEAGDQLIHNNAFSGLTVPDSFYDEQKRIWNERHGN